MMFGTRSLGHYAGVEVFEAPILPAVRSYGPWGAVSAARSMSRPDAMLRVPNGYDFAAMQRVHASLRHLRRSIGEA